MPATKRIVKKGTPPPASAHRAMIYEEMNDALRRVADDLEVRLTRESRGLLLTRYDVGLAVRDVRDGETTYGTHAVQALANYFNINATVLYDLAGITEVFERDRVEELSQIPLGGGGQFIAVAHLAALAKVTSAKTREALLDRVMDTGLSANALAAEILAAGHEKRHVRGGGRKPSVPATPLAAAQQVVSQLRTVNNRFDVWKDHLFDEIDQMDVSRVDTVLLARLQEAEAQMRQAEENLTYGHDRLLKNIRRVEGIVERLRGGGSPDDQATPAPPAPAARPKARPKAATKAATRPKTKAKTKAKAGDDDHGDHIIPLSEAMADIRKARNEPIRRPGGSRKTKKKKGAGSRGRR